MLVLAGEGCCEAPAGNGMVRFEPHSHVLSRRASGLGAVVISGVAKMSENSVKYLANHLTFSEHAR